MHSEDEANALLEEERQRGDSYKRRALALMVSCRAYRIEVRNQLTSLKIGECRDVAEALLERLAAAEADRVTAQSDAARLRELLRKCRLFVRYSKFSAGYQDENGKSQSYRSEDVQAEIDAALSVAVE